MITDVKYNTARTRLQLTGNGCDNRGTLYQGAAAGWVSVPVSEFLDDGLPVRNHGGDFDGVYRWEGLDGCVHEGSASELFYVCAGDHNPAAPEGVVKQIRIIQ